MTRRIGAACAMALTILALAAPATLATPVATDANTYAGLGRVFPDPLAGCQNAGTSPCSPNAKGNIPATQFIGYTEFVNALRAEVMATVLEPLGLTFPQYICMRILSQFPDRSNAELARGANVSPQAMNMVLRGLEERGLVTRPASVSSGRSLPAALTREGEQLLEKTDAGVREAENRLMANLSNRQRADFMAILASLGSDPF